MSRRRGRPTPRRRPVETRRTLPTWAAVLLGVLAVVALVLARPNLAWAVRQVADGSRGVAGALGVLGWVVPAALIATVRLHQRAALLWLGLWLLVAAAPGLSRRDSGRVEQALQEQAPGYLEGWLVGMVVVLVPLLGWYAWARRTGRLRT